MLGFWTVFNNFHIVFNRFFSCYSRVSHGYNIIFANNINFAPPHHFQGHFFLFLIFFEFVPTGLDNSSMVISTLIPHFDSVLRSISVLHP